MTIQVSPFGREGNIRNSIPELLVLFFNSFGKCLGVRQYTAVSDAMLSLPQLRTEMKWS